MLGATLPQSCSACILWGTILLLLRSLTAFGKPLFVAREWMVEITLCILINDEQKLGTLPLRAKLCQFLTKGLNILPVLRT